MSRQRPVLRNVGAVACLALLTAGCSPGGVHLDSPTLSGVNARACKALVDALPQSVSDQKRRKVDPKDGYGAAWGDPAIVLTCGVPKPKGLTKFATCQVTDKVGWYIPEREMTGSATDITMTTIGRAQNVEVRIPAAYFPPAATMVDLAPAIKKAIRDVKLCV
jgi:Protein of unknown function (DUF3515)